MKKIQHYFRSFLQLSAHLDLLSYNKDSMVNDSSETSFGWMQEFPFIWRIRTTWAEQHVEKEGIQFPIFGTWAGLRIGCFSCSINFFFFNVRKTLVKI